MLGGPTTNWFVMIGESGNGWVYLVFQELPTISKGISCLLYSWSPGMGAVQAVRRSAIRRVRKEVLECVPCFLASRGVFYLCFLCLYLAAAAAQCWSILGRSIYGRAFGWRMQLWIPEQRVHGLLGRHVIAFTCNHRKVISSAMLHIV